MNGLRRFMYGRYGVDQFSRALVILALILSVTASFTRYGILMILAYIPLCYVIFRTLSKNIHKRTQENVAYCRFADQVKHWFNSIKLSLIGTKTHKYYKCNHCKQTIRVPRGKGKICITCPKCKTEFVRRT